MVDTLPDVSINIVPFGTFTVRSSITYHVPPTPRPEDAMKGYRRPESTAGFNSTYVSFPQQYVDEPVSATFP